MCKFCKVFFKVIGILTVISGAAFAVYFWNLDQKLLDWVYWRANTLFAGK